MQSRIERFMSLMDTKNWVRISVCMVPGLAVSKLASQLDAPEAVRLSGTVLIAIGAIVWLGWEKLRAIGDSDKIEVIDEVDLDQESRRQAPDSLPQVTVTELLAAYENNAHAALRAIQMEIAVVPDIAAATAIDRAARRRRAESTLHHSKASS
ncbi:hypothetical protein [Noviherbaspirillum malthae]|uniref:hypothetical protein n=1 Tax=Noviherbaspirillum malthae TaxID=1260987 RepID=UPI00188F0137|nr:hypothetical protein [Noviherbaspirillum malthae]